MEFSDEDKIKATILYYLRRKKIIGNVHTSFDTVRKGFPSHLGKEVNTAVKQLNKQELILIKPAPYGLQISLNKARIKEIDEFIFRILNFKFD